MTVKANMIRLPIGILTDERISGATRVLMAYLQGPKVCWYRDERIAAITNLKASEVRRYRTRLIKNALMVKSGKGYRVTIAEPIASSLEALGAARMDDRPEAYPEVFAWHKSLDGLFGHPKLQSLREVSSESTREFWRYFDGHVRRVEALKNLGDPALAGQVALFALSKMPVEKFDDLLQVGPGLGGIIRHLNEDELRLALGIIDKLRDAMAGWRVGGSEQTVREAVVQFMDRDQEEAQVKRGELRLIS